MQALELDIGPPTDVLAIPPGTAPVGGVSQFLELPVWGVVLDVPHVQVAAQEPAQMSEVGYALLPAAEA